MKKVFAIIALMGVFTFGMTQSISAQDEAVDSAATEQVDSAAVDTAAAAATVDAADDEVASSEPVETGMYKNLKTKFIEGDAGFMAIVAIALVLGLAFCISTIIQTEKTLVVDRCDRTASVACDFLCAFDVAVLYSRLNLIDELDCVDL